MLHIWHEDNYIADLNNKNSSTQKFWEFLKINSVSTELNNAEIKGFCSNSKLLQHIKTTKINSNDTYIIFIDYALSNSATIKIYRDACNILKGKKNVYIPKVVCFEYLMLQFKYFDTWLKPTDISRISEYNYIKNVRETYLTCIKSGYNWKRNKDLRLFAVKFLKDKNINISESDIINSNISEEKLAAFILLNYTRISNNFLIDKTTLDACWTCNCCTRLRGYPNHNTTKPCNIYQYKKTSKQKAQNLWNCTEAKNIVSMAINKQK